MKVGRFVKLVNDATLGVLIEEVHSVHIEADGDLFTGSGGGSGRNTSGESTLFTNGEVEVNFCTHKLGNVNVTLNGCAVALGNRELVIVDTLRTQTSNNLLADVLLQSFCLNSERKMIWLMFFLKYYIIFLKICQRDR